MLLGAMCWCFPDQVLLSPSNPISPEPGCKDANPRLSVANGSNVGAIDKNAKVHQDGILPAVAANAAVPFSLPCPAKNIC